MSDQQLIEGLIAGDHKAINYIYDQLAPKVTMRVCRNSGSEDDAQDIFQEAIIMMRQKLSNGQFKIEKNFKGYFMTACWQMWLNKLREKDKKKTDPFPEDPDLQDIIVSGSLMEDDGSSERMEVCWQIAERCMEKLSAECQKVIKAFYHHKMSHVEIAEIMGYTPSYSRVKKNKCIDQYTKCVKSDPEYKDLEF